MGNRAFITGINGFVGTYLAKRLVSLDYEPIGISQNRSNGFSTDPALKEIDIRQVDIRNESALVEFLKENPVDEVYHLAGQANVPLSFENSELTWSVNFDGLRSLIRACDKAAAEAKILVVSSGSVYGQPRLEDLPITERTPACPDNPYSCSKLAGDLWALDFLRNHPLDLKIVRPFNHIGPGQAPAYAASSFAKQIAVLETEGGGALDVGRLDVKRDFTDVRDIVRAYPKILNQSQSGGVYNLGSGKSILLQEVLERLVAMSDADVEIRQDESRLRSSDPSEIRIDTELVKEMTGWQPEISLERTLSDTLNYWREQVAG